MTLTKFLLVLTSLLLWSSPSSQSTCTDYCGHLPIKYPFGSGTGCGSSAFRHHIICAENSNSLHLITKTGSYPIVDIDYQDQLIFITDPSMSTCSTANPSKGFSLDSDAPFTFFDEETFILLNCSTSPSSPLHRIYSNTNKMLCGGSNDSGICRDFYSCPPIASLDIPVSTCCNYYPTDFEPARFELDLKKLQCSSYAGLYGNYPDGPKGWEFGIALHYSFSVDGVYPKDCANCENSNGVCGYTGQFNAFNCNCGNGTNTTTDCNFPAAWNRGIHLKKIGFWVMFSWCIVAWKLLYN